MKLQNYLGKNVHFLFFIPIVTYIGSYLHLVFYHGRLNVLVTVVHEGGEYTLLQSILYASHFLGHIPMITTLAIYFVGVYLCLAGGNSTNMKRRFLIINIVAVILLVIGSLHIAVYLFGYEDTVAFIGQKKQAVNIYESGGAWNLHFPSSLLLLFFIPFNIYFVLYFFNRKISFSKQGLFLIIIALLLLIVFTILFNYKNMSAVVKILQDPRYQAHSVRELMTFPMTYFPIPLYFFLRKTKSWDNPNDQKLKHIIPIGSLLLIFLLGLSYQSYATLSRGVGNLAQKPYFAKGGQLGVPYLLSSHYFEHFLDTIYFSFICLILFNIDRIKKIQWQKTNP